MDKTGNLYCHQSDMNDAQTSFWGLIDTNNPRSSSAPSAPEAALRLSRQDEVAPKNLTRANQLDTKQFAPYVNPAKSYVRQQRAEGIIADLKCDHARPSRNMPSTHSCTRDGAWDS